MGADLACLPADGRIRRVLLVAPACVDGDAWRSVVSRLAGAALIAEPDPMLARYRGEGRCWTSATPVVVPGYDSLRGRLRPERSVRKLLRHAGVAEALLERAAFERGSRLRGSGHPLSCSLPAREPGALSSGETVFRLKGERAFEVDVWTFNRRCRLL